MPRRMALVLSAPVAIAVAVLAGCTTSSYGVQSSAIPSTGVPSTGGSATAASPAATVLHIVPGSKVTLAGSGCKPDAEVAIFAAASHASGRTLGQVTADASGGFSITVTVPYMGEPQATLAAMCDNTSGTTVPVTQRTIDYTSAG